MKFVHHDPSNFTYRIADRWFRVCDESSASALKEFLEIRHRCKNQFSEKVVEYWAASVDDTALVKSELVVHDHPFSERVHQVFEVAKFPSPISYPWEWSNRKLVEAGVFTLELRSLLVHNGLDLRDAAAINIQFCDTQPQLIDLGSIGFLSRGEVWRGLLQYLENFINPLSASYGQVISSSDLFRLGSSRGLSTEAAREIMTLRQRCNPRLFLFQSAVRRSMSSHDFNKRLRRTSSLEDAHSTELSLAFGKGLAKLTERLEGKSRKTQWSDYSTRDHYARNELETKCRHTVSYLRTIKDPINHVLDIGGNDGLIALRVAKELGVSVTVLDRDVGAIEDLDNRLFDNRVDNSQVTALIGDFTTPLTISGLLGEEFLSVFERLHADVVLCQAVLHHVVISQAVTMRAAIRALGHFGPRLLIEFATEHDPKVKILRRNISDWSGDYSLDCLRFELQREYHSVRMLGTTSEHRVIVVAEN